MSGKKPKRKVMRSFKLDEISAVDKPAQEGAKAVLMKRKQNSEKKSAAVAKSLGDRILDNYLATLQFSEPIYESISKGLADKAAAQACGGLAALETSLHSILGDSTLSNNKKLAMMKASVGEFLDYEKKEMPGVAGKLEKALSSEARSKAGSSEDEGDMNLRQLQKQMKDLNGKLEKVLAKQRLENERVEKDDDEAGDDTDMFGKDGASEEDEAAARLRALLSGGQKEAAGDYTVTPGGSMHEMDKGEGDEEFLEEAEKAEDDFSFEDGEAEKADSDEIDDGKVTTTGEEEDPIAAGSARPIGGGAGGGKRSTTKRVRLHDDDTISVEGRTFKKAKVGSTLFAVLKQQQDRLAKVEKQALEDREARELMEFSKVAEAELAHLPGTVEQKATLLKTLAGSLSQSERQLISKMLRAGEGAVVSAFRTVGTGQGGDVSKARGGFEKRISEVRARDNCSRTEAMQKARREYPDEYAVYQGN